MQSRSVVTMILLSSFLWLALGLSAQDSGEVYINPKDPAFLEKYSKTDFEGRFAVRAVSDQKNNYYIADFSMLPTRFEKIYFLNLVYGDPKIINIDGDISKDRLWFLADRQFGVKEILELFDQLRTRTEKAVTSFSPGEKEQWMKKADKYSKTE